MITNKEYGSDFHYVPGEIIHDAYDTLFADLNISYFFSGRSALYAIIEKGVKEKNWSEVFFPDYYCHEVDEYVAKLPIIISFYPVDPFSGIDYPVSIPDKPNTVIINVDFFGLYKKDFKSYQRAVIIEDCTHNLSAARTSQANYCFGSLRKELPLPVGGFCFSPTGLKIPRAIKNTEAEELALQKLSAMYLKKRYLDGHERDKAQFRKLFSEAEDNFMADYTYAGIPGVASAVLAELNGPFLLEKKHKNLSILSRYLDKLKSRTDVNIYCKGFGLTLFFEDATARNHCKKFLIENNIFPAILWPNQPFAVKHLEQRMLFIHADFRYNEEDLQFIAGKLIEHFK